MAGSADQKLALDAVDAAFESAVDHIFDFLRLNLSDNQSEAQSIARFEAALRHAKRARELAIASVTKIIP